MAGSSLLRLQSDERLVALVRDGHDPAFSAVVDRYRPELLRYATRIVGESRAEDIVQQALLNAHTALVSSQNDIQLRPWLYRIAHNAGLNVLRSSRDESELLDDRFAAAGGIEDDFNTRERLREAMTAIARLPEPQRDALTLQALEGRSHTEIAEALGTSPGAARQHLHRARTTVRAVVSAVTPYGLMARFAMAGGGEPASATLLTGAGASIGATAAKVGAGMLAAGAIATGTTGHVPFVHKHHQRPAAAETIKQAPATNSVLAVTPVVATGAPAVAVRATGHGRRRGGSSDDGSGDHSGKSGSGSSGSSADDTKGDDHGGDRSGSGDSSSGDGGRSGSVRSGSDDHGSHSGSGDSGSGSGDSGSGSGDSGSGSSGSGSDDSSSGGSGDDHASDTQTQTPTVTTPLTGDQSGSGDSGSGGDRSGSGSDDLLDGSGSGSGSGSSGDDSSDD